MFELEVRPFESRFGDRCPFCGESWNSRKRCDPMPADWTIQDSLRGLFAETVEKSCVVCGAFFSTTNHRKLTCSDDCHYQRATARNTERVRVYRERHQIQRACDFCHQVFTTHKPTQRFCSLSCGNRNRFRSAA